MSAERYPIRQLEPRGAGWQITRDGEKINTDGNFDTSDQAIVFANSAARRIMQWSRSEGKDVLGEYWYSSRIGSASWIVSVECARDKERIPGAFFVSQDPGCNIYIEPVGEDWHVKGQQDLTGMSWMEVATLTGMSPTEAINSASLLRIFTFFRVPTKELALNYGLYLWGRMILRSCIPPETGSMLKNRIRHIAIKLL